jgi:hypothetical protein
MHTRFSCKTDYITWGNYKQLDDDNKLSLNRSEVWVCRLNSVNSGQGPVSSFCEHGPEISNAKKGALASLTLPMNDFVYYISNRAAHSSAQRSYLVFGRSPLRISD